MRETFKKLRGFFLDDSGQGMVEYILIIGMIVLFILLALFIFRNAISDFIKRVTKSIGSQKPVTPK